jgi:hypothetical protein
MANLAHSADSLIKWSSEDKHSFKNSLLDRDCCIKEPALLPSVSARSPRTPTAVLITKSSLQKQNFFFYKKIKIKISANKTSKETLHTRIKENYNLL